MNLFIRSSNGNGLARPVEIDRAYIRHVPKHPRVSLLLVQTHDDFSFAGLMIHQVDLVPEDDCQFGILNEGVVLRAPVHQVKFGVTVDIGGFVDSRGGLGEGEGTRSGSEGGRVRSCGFERV